MPRNNHASDEELLLAADSELSARHAARVNAHLEQCSACRVRMQQFRLTSEEFSRQYQSFFEPGFSEENSRAALKIRLNDASERFADRPRRWARLSAGLAWARPFAVPAVVVLLIGVTIGAVAERTGWRALTASSDEAYTEPLPIAQLTPGDARPVPQGQVCSSAPFTSGDNLPTPLKRKVFEEYGMRNVSADHFEVDRLITPDLGGTNDIHNLWPEPSSSTVWNAHVKDQLESRLHQMVCDGDVDLRTAQRDIAANWIAAYKKYFNTDQPIS